MKFKYLFGAGHSDALCLDKPSQRRGSTVNDTDPPSVPVPFFDLLEDGAKIRSPIACLGFQTGEWVGTLDSVFQVEEERVIGTEAAGHEDVELEDRRIG